MPLDTLPAAASPRRWLLLTLLTVAYGMGAFGMLGVSPLAPSLVDGFRLSRLDVAFIVPSVYLGGLFFSLPAGHLADRWGVRPTFLGGLAVAFAVNAVMFRKSVTERLAAAQSLPASPASSQEMRP